MANVALFGYSIEVEGTQTAPPLDNPTKRPVRAWGLRKSQACIDAEQIAEGEPRQKNTTNQGQAHSACT